MPRKFLRNCALIAAVFAVLTVAVFAVEAHQLWRANIPARQIPRILIRRLLNDLGIFHPFSRTFRAAGCTRPLSLSPARGEPPDTTSSGFVEARAAHDAPRGQFH